MARQDLTTTESAPAVASQCPKDTRWFTELAGVLFELAGTLNRTFLITGIIAVGAAAIAYWGAGGGRYYVAVGAMAVFGLATLVWCIASVYLLCVNISAIVKWALARRRGTPGRRAPGPSTIRTADTE